MEVKKKVLVVDDALDVRKILQFHLQKRGYEVLEAQDGAEGLKMWEQHHPDLLIMDINMPKMGGLELYSKLTAKTGKPPLPIIVLTTREELRNFFMDLEVDGFIKKPFDIDQLTGEIDAVMAKRYGTGKAGEAGRIEGPVKILIVEDDQVSSGKLLLQFADAGFAVNYAKSGMEAFEKLLSDVPHVILIKLGLLDISGDLFVTRLKNMPRTMDIPCILYTQREGALLPEIVQRIRDNTKSELFETDNPILLLKQVNRTLNM